MTSKRIFSTLIGRSYVCYRMNKSCFPKYLSGNVILQNSRIAKDFRSIRPSLLIKIRNYSSAAYTSRYADYEHIQVTAPHDHILHVELNRPDKRNAINRDMFREISECFSDIGADQQCRAVVISGAGKMFCSGIDYIDMVEQMTSMNSGSDAGGREDVAARAKYIRKTIILLQNSFNSIVKCPKPVIAAIHSGCIGAGVDLISATDIRYGSKDAYFSIREVAVGLAADLGTLQRMPKLVGNDSVMRELAYTARDMQADEAKEVSSFYFKYF